jgi:hypothetical protein
VYDLVHVGERFHGRLWVHAAASKKFLHGRAWKIGSPAPRTPRL